MTSNDIVVLIITGSLGLVFFVMAIMLLFGKGAFLIAAIYCNTGNHFRK